MAAFYSLWYEYRQIEQQCGLAAKNRFFRQPEKSSNQWKRNYEQIKAILFPIIWRDELFIDSVLFGRTHCLMKLCCLNSQVVVLLWQRF